ncbi:hypothetical protein NECAME_00508, partial [Necator americanus]
MNESLREYERKLDQMDMEKEELHKEIKKLRELYDREKTLREAKEIECEENAALVAELEGRIARLTEDADSWKTKLENAILEAETEKSRAKKQIDTVAELQRTISELNDRIAKHDSILLEEKNLRRKLEREQERAVDDHAHAQGALAKLQQKYDVLKEECRRKDHQISKLEKKLVDKEVVMAECMRELKEQHKTRVTELEEKLAEIKKKNL